MAIDQGQMQAYAKQFGQLVARTWSDEAFKRRLLAEPAAVLAEQDIELPPGMEVRVYEDSPTAVHLALPPKPSDELADALAGQAQMNPYGQRYLQLTARAWADPAFKARLLAEPTVVLAEQGIRFPPEVAVEVHESTPTTVHLMLPPKPSDELSDEQLDAVAGGDCLGTAGTISSFSTSPVMLLGTLSTVGTVGCGG
jgi:nitrile hydratase alpha subunit